ncbi:MAG: 5-oxoprolinase subunit PxpA [Candidatus Caenarcaniphilales bacterium]|nr:5-oxoprolinase subunit PxpA [Candidatus Caenarcaniphilales bacterium]
MKPDNTAFAIRHSLDLNCDLAQSWGAYKHAAEEELLAYVSSVNIACGGHAGDPPSIMAALKAAKDHHLNVGAHIGFPDLGSFGRREFRLDYDELNAYIAAQLGLLAGMAKSYGITLTHFRPHGAMYFRCAIDPQFAEILAKAVARFSGWLTFVGPAGSYLAEIKDKVGIKVAGEVHLDRPYRKDGSLLKFPNQKTVSFETALSQARSLIYEQRAILEGGKTMRFNFRTIHLNMDRIYSVNLAQQVHQMLKQGKALGSLEDNSYFSNAVIEDLQEKVAYRIHH